MTRLIVYGAGDFGQVVKPLAQECGFDVIGFIDDWHSGVDILGPSAGLPERFPPSGYQIAFAIGYRYMDARWRAFERLSRLGYEIPALVHPKAVVAVTATIDDGTFVMAGSIVDTRTHLGQLSVVWPGAIINHDAIIGGNTFLSPGCIVCGHSEIGAGSFIGAGAVVVDHVRVPPGAFIKAATRYAKRELKE